MDAPTEKAFELASDLAKQLITLSTAILTVTAVFTQIIKAQTSGRTAWWLRAAWILYLTSILMGVLHLMALTGTMARPPSGTPTAESLYGTNVVIWAIPQIVFFMLATAFVIRYGWQLPGADDSRKTPETDQTPPVQQPESIWGKHVKSASVATSDKVATTQDDGLDVNPEDLTKSLGPSNEVAQPVSSARGDR